MFGGLQARPCPAVGGTLFGLARVTSLFGIIVRSAKALGAIAGGMLAATARIRAPMLAGAPPLAGAAAVLAWRHRRGLQ